MHILLVFLLVILLIFPITRCVIFHLPQYIYNRITDLWDWFYNLKKNEAQFLGVRVFIANSEQAMGSGKTLNLANYVISYYNQYNDKKIKKDNKIYIQKLIVFSNFNISNIPTVPFKAFEQLNEWELLKKNLEEKDPCSIYKCLFVIDELAAVCNSREYRNNFTISNLQALLQQRHLGICGCLGSAQRFHMIDAAFRGITDLCVTSKLLGLLPWRKRFLISQYYLGHDMEEAQSELMVQPVMLDVKFLYNKNYNCYNTHQIATQLIHNKNNFSDEQILNNLALHQDNNTNLKLKKKYQKSKK